MQQACDGRGAANPPPCGEGGTRSVPGGGRCRRARRRYLPNGKARWKAGSPKGAYQRREIFPRTFSTPSHPALQSRRPGSRKASMDWNAAIEKNREALKRVLAMLVAMAGLDGGRPTTLAAPSPPRRARPAAPGRSRGAAADHRGRARDRRRLAAGAPAQAEADSPRSCATASAPASSCRAVSSPMRGGQGGGRRAALTCRCSIRCPVTPASGRRRAGFPASPSPA